MKYKVTRYQPKTITLSEYCERKGSEINVIEVSRGVWQARTHVWGGHNSLTINGAIDGLCEALSGPDLKVIPGTDLEAAE